MQPRQPAPMQPVPMPLQTALTAAAETPPQPEAGDLESAGWSVAVGGSSLYVL